MPKRGSKKATGNLFPPPCPDLYIYLMKGVLRGRDEEFLGNAFIGNWVEGLTMTTIFPTMSGRGVGWMSWN
ncbi:MAG: hypothetical protein JRJ79_16785 [Deltaproteobacteria bacterium]|nr:hypothetical protein [Deltaproteobacteria bacterium]